MRVLFAVMLLASLALPGVAAPRSAEAADCQFVLGFKAVHDLVPDKVGDCKTNEYHNPDNGDGLQETTGGLLVWRKADNWTAFTDGYRTWINGPSGLQQRLNTERFSWEQEAPKPAATPAPTAGVQWAVHEDGEKRFKYPQGWKPTTRNSGGLVHNYYDSPDGQAALYYLAPFDVGPGFKADDLIAWNTKAWASRGNFAYGPREQTTIGGFPAVVQWYEFTGYGASRGVGAAIQQGTRVHYIAVMAVTPAWPRYEPVLLEVIRSYTPK